MAPGDSRAAQDAARTHARFESPPELGALKDLAAPTNYLPVTLTPRELDRPEELKYVNGQWMTPKMLADYEESLKSGILSVLAGNRSPQQYGNQRR